MTELPTREAIAEIIEPLVFCDVPFTDDPMLLQMHEQSNADVLRKAERILALIPTPKAGLAVDVDALAFKYSAEYVKSTEGADYEPTTWERELIEDALYGFIADHRLTLSTPQPRRDSDGSPKDGDGEAAPLATARAEGIAQ